MKWKEVEKYLEFGYYTALVCDTQKARMWCDGVEICEQLFEDTDYNTEYDITPLSELPEVRDCIAEQWLPDLKEMTYGDPEVYSAWQSDISSGKALVCHWHIEKPYGSDMLRLDQYLMLTQSHR